MILPYGLRLVCLCLSVFFLMNLVLGLPLWLVAPAAVRRIERLAAHSAARILLTLRVAPASVALLVVFGLCVPSYLWMEPVAVTEPVGWFCMLAAALCLVTAGMALTRSVRAVLKSVSYGRSFERSGRSTRLAGDEAPVWVMSGRIPLFALAGLLRPKLFVAQAVLDALSEDQMAAALRHERGHREAHDNFKRLCILLAPDIFPFCGILAGLDRAWARFTEWAADDAAAAGDAEHALSLASALVRVARLNGTSRPPALVTSLMPHVEDLEVRVDRLLGPAAAEVSSPHVARYAICASLASIAWLAAALHPSALVITHRLLEHLVN